MRTLHAHTLEHRLAAMWWKIRSRTGSDSALATSATCSACRGEIVDPPGRQAPASDCDSIGMVMGG